MIHPILDALDGSEQAWLKDLLFTFNEGNIGKFEALGPRLGQEVSPSHHARASLGAYFLVQAYPFYKLRFPQTEDLPDGSDRGGFQAHRKQSLNDLPNRCRGSALTTRRSRTPGNEGAQVSDVI